MESMSEPTTAESAPAQPDADGYLPATIALACPYAGCGGELVPQLEYTGYAHSEHRDFEGTECYRCLAEWNKDGSPRRGPHAATIAYERRVAEETVRLEADPAAISDLAQEKA